MGGDIIADKYALLKTRGNNGVSFTHFAEDTLSGCRAVVKVGEGREGMGVEYLKAINMLREAEVSGLLLPLEGGILEGEEGYYLAFPELGEPSLENYLRMGAPLSCGEILRIGRGLLRILEGLHAAGFCHLFIGTRNVFYRPRGEVTLKDAALRGEFFHPLLELMAVPDFSYFSPEVMDGRAPGSEADLYAVGKLMEELLGRAADAAEAGEEAAVRWLAGRCCAAGSGQEAASAAQVAQELEATISRLRAGLCAEDAARRRIGREGAGAGRVPHEDMSSSRRRVVGIILGALLVLAVLCGAAAAYLATVGGDRAPALGRGGGSLAGEDGAREALREARDVTGAAQAVEGGAPEAESAGVPVVEKARRQASPAGEGEEAAHGPGESAQPADPCTEPSPQPPVASFVLTPSEGQSPLRVYLDASASYDPDGRIVSFAWSCGGSGRCLYHVFESNLIPAAVPVTLTVTDDGGHSARTTLYVTLY